MDFGIRGIAPRLSVILMVVLAALIAPSAVSAQDYPSRPVKMIVPVPAGGITDVLARILQEPLTRKWGQPIVIDNRPGAGGNLGTEAAFKSDPDGYTVLFSIPGPFTVNPTLYQKLNFDPSEFVPVALLATIPTALIAGPKVPARTLPEFIAYARANPGKVTIATQGPATTSHLTSEWFQQVADVKFVTVPYRGSAPALQGMLAGDVDVMFDNLGVSLALVREGRLKVLAVATEKRLASVPDAAAIAETLPGFVSATWVGAFLPPKTPKQIADKLTADFTEAVREPQVARRFRDHASEPAGLAPEATAAFVRNEAERWKKVIHTAGIKLD
ncbi:MAG: Bug family tripartite tricarboxylate transporter substrate binding protein [Xanthobacteraceae bacterium]